MSHDAPSRRVRPARSLACALLAALAGCPSTTTNTLTDARDDAPPPRDAPDVMDAAAPPAAPLTFAGRAPLAT